MLERAGAGAAGGANAHHRIASPHGVTSMAIPIGYNLRNLVVRRTTTLMTALGIGLTVAVLVTDLALANGLKRAFRASGNLLQILVMRRGSEAEFTSAITR